MFKERCAAAIPDDGNLSMPFEVAAAEAPDVGA